MALSGTLRGRLSALVVNRSESRIDQTIFGTNAADTQIGGFGDDRIVGRNAADRLVGGRGDDALRGGAGFETMLGGRGADLIVGGAGGDRLVGGRGDDTMKGGDGDDRVTPADEHVGAVAGRHAQGGVDTVVVTGATASACVRATVEDAIADGFRPIIVRETIADRIAGAVEWNLFDMDAKFGDVESLEDVLDHMRRNVEPT